MDFQIYRIFYLKEYAMKKSCRFIKIISALFALALAVSCDSGGGGGGGGSSGGGIQAPRE